MRAERNHAAALDKEKAASGPHHNRTQRLSLPVLTQAPPQACPGPVQSVSWAEGQRCIFPGQPAVPAEISQKVNATQPAVASHAAAAWRVLISESAPPMVLPVIVTLGR